MNKQQYTKDDIEIAKSISALQALQEATLKSVNESRSENKVQFSAVWKKIDCHTTEIRSIHSSISRIYGGIAVVAAFVTAVATAAWKWLTGGGASA